MAVAFLASSDDAVGSVCCFFSTILVIGYIFGRKKATAEPPPLSMPATPPPVWKVSGTTAGSSSGSLFDPFRDARVPAGIQGVKNYLLPGDGDNLVHSVTLNDDFIAITRGGDEHQAILLDSATVASLQLGALSEYPPTRYHMILSRGKETATFPVSFHGWLNLFDACRKAGGTLEAAEEISDEMRIKVLGPAGAARTPAAAKATAAARPTKCPTCGAALSKRGPCEYCGNVP
jgi:hypothetical protein